MSAPHSTDLSTHRGNNLLWIVAILLLALILPEVLTRPIFGDDGFYLWAATQASHGVYPVRDYWCIDTAGIIAWFTLLRPFLQLGTVAYWTVLAGVVIAMSWLLGALAYRVSGSFRAGVWSAVLLTIYQLRCIPQFSLMGKDMVASPFLIGGMLIAGGKRFPLSGHLVMGIGIAMKPTLGMIWLIWTVGQFYLDRVPLRRALLRGIVEATMMGLPILAITLWAERNSWGLGALRANAGLAGSYGAYLSRDAVFKLTHLGAQCAWGLPACFLGWPVLRSLPLRNSLPIWALLLGGFVNAVIQPMFNVWYFTPLIAGCFVLAAFGIERVISSERAHLCLLIAVGLFAAGLPSTNLRWLKLLTDKDYNLARHQGRIMSELGKGNATAEEQEWLHRRAAELIPASGRVGSLVDDGTLLWALRDYRPAMWSIWVPSWHAAQLARELADAPADLIIGVESPLPAGTGTTNERTTQLWWPLPPAVEAIIAREYHVEDKFHGLIIYIKNRPGDDVRPKVSSTRRDRAARAVELGSCIWISPNESLAISDPR